MNELEEKLGAVLNDPQMMQKIMSMAQALGGGKEPAVEANSPSPPPSAIDPKLLKGLSGCLQHNNIDRNQQALLHALSPYLSQNRVSKLERAMRAAKVAGAASAFLNTGGLQLLTGR